jgi:hypothetical protein
MRMLSISIVITSVLLGILAGGVTNSAPPSGTRGSATSSRPKPDAEALASLAFMKLNNGLDAMDGVRTSNIVLSYDVPGFARSGEVIIEGRVARRGEVRAVLWIHPETEAVYPVAGTFRPNDYYERLSTAEDERNQVKKLVMDEYFRLSNRVLDDRLPLIITRFHLARDVGEFAKAGEDIYDVRWEGKEGVEGLFWANVKDKKVKVLAGLPRTSEDDDQVPVGRDERSEINDLVFKEYVRLSNRVIPGDVPLLIVRWRMASAVEGLTKAGEDIYEVRLKGKEGVEAVFWVNLKEKKVKGLAGPWPAGQGAATQRP